MLLVIVSSHTWYIIITYHQTGLDIWFVCKRVLTCTLPLCTLVNALLWADKENMNDDALYFRSVSRI